MPTALHPGKRVSEPGPSYVSHRLLRRPMPVETHDHRVVGELLATVVFAQPTHDSTNCFGRWLQSSATECSEEAGFAVRDPAAGSRGMHAVAQHEQPLPWFERERLRVVSTVGEHPERQLVIELDLGGLRAA